MVLSNNRNLDKIVRPSHILNTPPVSHLGKIQYLLLVLLFGIALVTRPGDYLSGAPTFTNTGGDIQINGVIPTNDPLVIVASRDIPASSSVTAVDAGNTNSNPGSSSQAIPIVVGASLTDPQTSSRFDDAPFSAGSTSGGQIDIGNTVLDTRSSSGQGGEVTLIAMTNTPTSGTILVPPISPTHSPINSAGSGIGTSGNVVIISGTETSKPVGVTATSPPVSPSQVPVLSVPMRSTGMAADGSCSERTLKASGTFNEGNPTPKPSKLTKPTKSPLIETKTTPVLARAKPTSTFGKTTRTNRA